MKKTLAILLSLALVICMIPATAATAFAETAALTDNMISIAYSTAEYNGSNALPTVTVTGGAVENTDYTVEWKKTGEGTTSTVTSGSDLAAGTYEVTVKPKSGSTILTASTDSEGITSTKKFTITKYNLTNHTVKIEVDNQVTGTSEVSMDSIHFYVNGKEASGTLREFFTSRFTVTKGENQTVSLSEKDSKDNFEGEPLTATYIEKSDISNLTFNVASTVYDGKIKNIKDLVTVKSSNTTISTGNYDVTCNEEVKKAKTYTLVVTGKGDYAGKKSDVSLTVSPRGVSNISIDAVPTRVQGQNETAIPDLVVKDYLNGSYVTLTAGEDYNVGALTNKRTKNSTTDTYDIPVTFTGNYSGSKTATVDVVNSAYGVNNMQVYYGDKNVTSVGMTATAYRYNGSSQPISSSIKVYKDASAYTAKNPLSTSYYDVVYKYQDTTKTTADKTVSTTSPVEAKVYSVYIVGKNGYAGEKYIGTYTIPQYNMSFVTVSVSMASATSVPAVTVRSAYENITFVKDKDYAVSYNTYASTGKVWVTVTPIATGNLTGSSNSGYYSIVSKSITSCTASFKDGKTSASYTGSVIPVEVVVKDGYYTTLTKNTHYTVTYKNEAGKTVYEIKDAGRYTIEINGMNGYTGTTYLYFTVTGNDISTYTVVLDKTSVDATGYSVVLPKVTKVYSGSTTLYSTNYTVSYQNAAGTTVTSAYAPGTYKVAVTGAGKYSGTAYATFTIVGKTQSITGVNSTYTVKPTTEAFKLTPKAAEGTFTYTSSDNTVATVSSTGVVTPLKAGRAKITIKTTGNTRYNPAEFSTVIKVYPTKAVITKKPWTTGKSKIKVRWNKQDNVTRYEIRYSRVKSFAKGTYLTKKVDAAQNDYTTQSTTIKNLQSGQKYYVKVRAVKEVYNDYGKKLTYYGEWSGWRTVYAK